MLHESDEARTRSHAILCLCTMLPTIDDQHPVRRHPGSGQRDQPCLDVGRQRRGADIEAQFDRGRYLVHVLAAWSRGTDETFLDVALIEEDGVADSDHHVVARAHRTAGRLLSFAE